MKLKLFYILILLGCIGCSSCHMAQKSYPATNKFTLNVKSPKKMTARRSRKILFVNSTSAIPQFSDLNFVYRTGNTNYLTDYYNEFFTLPTSLVTQIIVHYLSATKLFRLVTNDYHAIHFNYILNSKITELYADYRCRNQPKAVITIQFILLNPSCSNTILLNKTLSATVPLQQKNSQSLVNAWNIGLKTIMQRLTYNLRKIRI